MRPYLPVLALAVLGSPWAAADTSPAPSPTAAPAESAVPDLVDAYLDRWAATFPTAALGAGLHSHERQLEDLSPERRAAWVAFVRATGASLDRALAQPGLERDERLDADLLRRETRRQLHEHTTLRSPARDPLWWTGPLANATTFLLVRDDAPVAERMAAAVARATQIPRLASQAREALDATPPAEISPDLARIAAGQVRSAASFYRDGFAAAAPADEAALAAEMKAAGATAATALDDLGTFLEELAGRATGDFRLGDGYAETFRLVTGLEDAPSAVLARAEAALAAKRREAAAFGREIWSSVFPDVAAPPDDRELLDRLFRRVEEDRPGSAEELLADYRGMVGEVVAFVREHHVVTMPTPLEVRVELSPDFFVGQAFGGVYPPGPYAPEAPTLLFLPTPASSATPEQRDSLFRAFNDHFNRMIVPHELIPGHTLQLAWAARHPHKVRALFGDGVYIEGWGTFSERIMLDLGWGGPLDRVAHLKKQMENIARTIADIRVHTTGMTRDELTAFVTEEALQDPQLAANMWARAMTSSPQLTFYFLGYEQVMELYEAVRRARGEAFSLQAFTDGLMTLGPVPLAEYHAILATPPAAPEASERE